MQQLQAPDEISQKAASDRVTCTPGTKACVTFCCCEVGE